MASDALRDWLVAATLDPSLRWVAPADRLTDDDRALVADPARLTALVTGRPDDWPAGPLAGPPSASPAPVVVALRVRPHPTADGLGHVVDLVRRADGPPVATWAHDTERPAVQEAVAGVGGSPTLEALTDLMRALTGRA